MGDQWDTRFDSHPLWGALDALKSQLDSVDLPTEPQMASAYNRILRMISTVGAYRDAENSKDLFTNTMLQSVYNAVVQYVTNQLAQYTQNPAAYAANLTSAADNVDTVYDELAKWPALSTRGRAVAAGQAASQYEEASIRALSVFEEQTTDLDRQFASLRETFDSATTQAELSRTEATNEWSAATSRELDALRSQIGSLETRIDNGRDRVETLTSETQATLQTQLDTLAETAETRISEAIATETRHVRSETGNAVAVAKRDRDSIAALHGEVDKLTKETRNTVEAFARRAVADDYQKNARNKSMAGWFWDVLGFAVGAVPLSLLLYHFLVITDSPDSAATLTLSRVGISAAAVGVAALCFHRGRQNHNESRLAKRTDLRVRTVHQFLANLDPDVQQAVLEGMADQIYLQGKLDDPDNPSSGDEASGRDLLRKYLDKVVERREKAEYEANQIP